MSFHHPNKMIINLAIFWFFLLFYKVIFFCIVLNFFIFEGVIIIFLEFIPRLNLCLSFLMVSQAYVFFIFSLFELLSFILPYR